jgi:hypothetical protein
MKILSYTVASNMNKYKNGEVPSNISNECSKL